MPVLENSHPKLLGLGSFGFVELGWDHSGKQFSGDRPPFETLKAWPVEPWLEKHL